MDDRDEVEENSWYEILVTQKTSNIHGCNLDPVFVYVKAIF